MKLKPRPREGAPADLKREPAPRSGLARRLSVGLRRRVSGFARTGTDDMSSDGEDPAASPRPPAPAAPPSSAAIPAAPVGRGGDARAPPAVPLPVSSNLDDVDGPAGGALAREVGTNAQEYLDECFYTEGPVLARDKFEAVPQLAVADLTILDHIGHGTFCDVCTVVVNGGQRAKGRAGHTYAMKRLRRQVCADADLFTMGAEDLVHETALLAGLDHPHIIQLRGRAAGSVAATFATRGGYFVLLEHLVETLPDRLDAWRRDGTARGGGRLKAAREIADATAYLHSRRLVFRDLKPDNVGFDAAGRAKLFDFGFAAGLPEGLVDPTGLLYDRCGTPRYMAPEVGLEQGYGVEADVYSFGVLLWEMCALAKPFAAITKPEEFERVVFREGERPPIDKGWPSAVRRLLRGCWATAPDQRPTMKEVKSSLSVAMASVDF